MHKGMDQIQHHVRTFLQASGSHGFDHTARVTRLCRSIGIREGADMAILIPAALFHDIARPLEEETGIPHEEQGAEMAEAYLRSIQYPGDMIHSICHAIRVHRYSLGIAPETPEAEILSDADKLDAMGATGIARTFMQAGEEASGIPGAVAHFHLKLLKLKNRMYTETAREMAEERHAFLVDFLRELEHEESGD
ncbi:MAG: Metal dependent phosphohydrolase [Methanomicrobiales archaeon 53_19]|uniref:HD domain-containing protein n=1 Tax=Methanocalculus sp. TaxID=2004547 RepID=UPI00074B26FC|nr:HD domain-containing protein [Methanocalculus sp.]KUK71256.1 MAG: Metal dependent phosphohydrolase [Methanocalculus sp. 52_23]KUL05141.1 MAG: Metal dependent phosphohydrolase [Methanomicrobiales archaeon 53_19]HIJ05854.1 HD domain-containing protein [Methanocalculus sp.]